MTGINWIASYPKSGNTWMRILLTFYRDPALADQPLHKLDGSLEVLNAHLFDEITGATSSDLTAQYMAPLRRGFHRALVEELPEDRLVKTHDAAHLGDGTPLFWADGTARAIHLVRNPLDVAVSYASHIGVSHDQVIEDMAKPNAKIGRRARRMDTDLEQHMGSWSLNVESWSAVTDFPVLTLRYEDLLADTEQGLTEVLRFLGIAPEPERVRRVVDLARFDRLKASDANAGFAIPVAKSGQFFRSGTSNDWRNHLSPSQADRIRADHGAVMARLGYS